MDLQGSSTVVESDDVHATGRSTSSSFQAGSVPPEIPRTPTRHESGHWPALVDVAAGRAVHIWHGADRGPERMLDCRPGEPGSAHHPTAQAIDVEASEFLAISADDGTRIDEVEIEHNRA